MPTDTFVVDTSLQDDQGNTGVRVAATKDGDIYSLTGGSSGGTLTGPLTDRSGSITTGGSAQQVAAANTSRRYLLIVNMSAEYLYVNFGATATADTGSIPLAPAANATEAGGALTFEAGFVPVWFRIDSRGNHRIQVHL